MKRMNRAPLQFEKEEAGDSRYDLPMGTITSVSIACNAFFRKRGMPVGAQWQETKRNEWRRKLQNLSVKNGPVGEQTPTDEGEGL